jgi:hypothetical protein
MVSSAAHRGYYRTAEIEGETLAGQVDSWASLALEYFGRVKYISIPQNGMRWGAPRGGGAGARAEWRPRSRNRGPAEVSDHLLVAAARRTVPDGA